MVKHIYVGQEGGARWAPEPDEVKRLAEGAGWPERSAESWGEALARSHTVVYARHTPFGEIGVYDKPSLSGFARLTGDGALRLYLCDVIVDSRFAGLGVGDDLLGAVKTTLTKLNQLSEENRLISTHAFPASDNIPREHRFFGRYGFVPTDSMLWVPSAPIETPESNM